MAALLAGACEVSTGTCEVSNQLEATCFSQLSYLPRATSISCICASKSTRLIWEVDNFELDIITHLMGCEYFGILSWTAPLFQQFP